MYLFVLKILRKVGVDGAIAYTVIGRLCQAFSNLITLVVLAYFLSPVERGFYFTFASIVAFHVFIELGFSFVITQFASHEKASLKWMDSGVLVGQKQFKDRLASLLKLVLKWYGFAAIVMVLLLLPGGYLFFAKQHGDYGGVVWQAPWFSLILLFAVYFYFYPLSSFLEGCGKVKEVAKMRLFQDLAANLLLWIGLFSKLGLWVFPLAYLGRSLLMLLWVMSSWRKVFFVDILKIKPQAVINWRQEILPFHWRISLSWISNVLIFQLINPVLFAYHGAVVAGQMGLSLSAFNGIIVIAMAWINTKVPVFGNLVVRKEYVKLDNVFFRALKHSFVVAIFLISSLIVVVYSLKFMQIPLGDRFLPMLPFSVLGAVVLLKYLIFAQATYLRAHKQDPLFITSVTTACLMSLSTFIFGKYYSIVGVISGCFVLICFSLVWTHIVFLQKRKLWHCQS